MLHWLQLKLPDKYRLLIKLFTFSSMLHMAICYILFFLHGKIGVSTLVEVHANNAQAVVRVISLNKPKQTDKTGLGSNKKQSIQSGQKKKQSGNVLKGLQQKQKTTLGRSVSNGKPKKSVAKKIEKKIEKPIIQPSVATKPEPKMIEKKIPLPEKVIEQAVVAPQTITPLDQENVTTDEQIIEYLTPKEYNQALIQDALKEAIVSVWAPPAGMNQNLSCHVVITVGFDGVILTTDIEQKSGVLIYDIAVEQAIAQVVMPQPLWGKKVKIIFKP
jgi:hypothetical protein